MMLKAIDHLAFRLLRCAFTMLGVALPAYVFFWVLCSVGIAYLS